MTSFSKNADTQPIASLPVALLRPFPRGYRIPLWRWIVLPGIAYMAKRNGGAWLSGTLELFPTTLRFRQGGAIRSRTPISVEIPIEDQMEITFRPGMASERLILDRNGNETIFMLVRGGDFVDKLRQAQSGHGVGADARGGE